MYKARSHRKKYFQNPLASKLGTNSVVYQRVNCICIFTIKVKNAHF